MLEPPGTGSLPKQLADLRKLILEVGRSRLVGQAWEPLSYRNSWGDADLTQFPGGAVRHFPGNIVQFAGAMSHPDGSVTHNGQVFAVLPPRYIPSKRIILPLATNTGRTVCMQVFTDGNCTISSVTNLGTAYLDSTFYYLDR